MLVIPGSPLMAVSTGKVMNRSTSTGPRAGAVVRMSTWFGVTSGTASIGSRRIEKIPSPTTRSAMTMTRNRFRNEKSRMRSIIEVPPPVSYSPPMLSLEASDLR